MELKTKEEIIEKLTELSKGGRENAVKLNEIVEKIENSMSSDKQFMMRLLDFDYSCDGATNIAKIYDRTSSELKTDIDFIVKCIDKGYIEPISNIEYELSKIDKEQASKIWLEIAKYDSKQSE